MRLPPGSRVLQEEGLLRGSSQQLLGCQKPQAYDSKTPLVLRWKRIQMVKVNEEMNNDIMNKNTRLKLCVQKSICLTQ
jgi:hypothetical protein